MFCIYCGNRTQVTNSRLQRRKNSTWRRRECLACKKTTTSVEFNDLSRSITVLNNGHKSPFERDKLFVSIYKSLQHRDDAQRDATAICDTVINSLKFSPTEPVLSIDIIKTVHQVLKRFDTASATHYKAFHRSI